LGDINNPILVIIFIYFFGPIETKITTIDFHLSSNGLEGKISMRVGIEVEESISQAAIITNKRIERQITPHKNNAGRSIRG